MRCLRPCFFCMSLCVFAPMMSQVSSRFACCVPSLCRYATDRLLKQVCMFMVPQASNPPVGHPLVCRRKLVCFDSVHITVNLEVRCFHLASLSNWSDRWSVWILRFTHCRCDVHCFKFVNVAVCRSASSTKLRNVLIRARCVVLNEAKLQSKKKFCQVYFMVE